MNPEVVIIGGGIVGCSCAYYLARAGVQVHLVEKGSLGSGASKSGMMHVVTWEEPPVHLLLARKSRHLYHELSQELPMDIEFREAGSIAVVENPDGMVKMQATVKRLQEWGLKCRLVDNPELLKMEPNMARDVSGGAVFEEDALVNPLYATQALARVARDLGAIIETDTGVISIELSGDGSSVKAVKTTRGTILTENVVIASGAWSGIIGEMMGLEIPVSPRKGTLVVTVPVPKNLMNHMSILAAGYMDSLQNNTEDGVAVSANIQQARNGNLVIGSSRQFVGFDPAVDSEWLHPCSHAVCAFSLPSRILPRSVPRPAFAPIPRICCRSYQLLTRSEVLL